MSDTLKTGMVGYICCAGYGLHSAECPRTLLWQANNALASAEQRIATLQLDAERLDFLDAQRKWGDCFVVQYLDSGDVYVRPWRYANQTLPYAGSETETYGDHYTVAQTIREAIDAAQTAATDPL